MATTAPGLEKRMHETDVAALNGSPATALSTDDAAVVARLRDARTRV